MTFKLNEAKSRILVLCSQLPEYHRYSRYIAMKLGYTYEYVNKQVQDLAFMGVIRTERHGHKAFILVQGVEFIKQAKEVLSGENIKQRTLNTDKTITKPEVQNAKNRE